MNFDAFSERLQIMLIFGGLVLMYKFVGVDIMWTDVHICVHSKWQSSSGIYSILYVAKLKSFSTKLNRSSQSANGQLLSGFHIVVVYFWDSIFKYNLCYRERRYRVARSLTVSYIWLPREKRLICVVHNSVSTIFSLSSVASLKYGSKQTGINITVVCNTTIDLVDTQQFTANVNNIQLVDSFLSYRHNGQ